MIRRMSKKLTELQSKIAAEFATVSPVALDAVSIGSSTTVGDVFQSLLNITQNQPLTEFNKIEETDVQKAYKKKYEEKLLERAREEGFSTIEELLEAKKKAQYPKQSNEPPKNSGKKETSQEKPKNNNALPSTCKKLDEIVKIEMLNNETAERIGQIWNGYHASKNGISASLDGDFYKKLYERSCKYPMVYFSNVVCVTTCP